MCLINVSFQQHPNYKLIIAANRDEFYERPTKEAHFWSDYPQIFGGRDLRGKGTWLATTTSGKFAALTNYRHPDYMYGDQKTRGQIVTDFLLKTHSPDQYAQHLIETAHQFNGYNLLFGDIDQLYYFNNIENQYAPLKPGFHSLSNAFLNTPWPKVSRATSLLQQYIDEHTTIEPAHIFSILQDQTIATDEQLPSTGVSLQLERQLSPVFIQTEDYGTRCSTVILVTTENEVHIYERSYDEGKFLSDAFTTFQL